MLSESLGSAIFAMTRYKTEKVSANQNICGIQDSGFNCGIPAFSAASAAELLNVINNTKNLSINS
jgi:hypothetical protein